MGKAPTDGSLTHATCAPGRRGTLQTAEIPLQWHPRLLAVSPLCCPGLPLAPGRGGRASALNVLVWYQRPDRACLETHAAGSADRALPGSSSLGMRRSGRHSTSPGHLVRRAGRFLVGSDPASCRRLRRLQLYRLGLRAAPRFTADPDQPRVGDIIVLQPRVQGAHGRYGHVAYVTAVSGTQVTVSEMNSGGGCWVVRDSFHTGPGVSFIHRQTGDGSDELDAGAPRPAQR